MAKLPGWNAEDHVAAVAVVRQTCVITFPSKRSHFCLDVLGSGALGEDAARTFLETHLRAEPIEGGGLLTAYYSPWYEARTAPEGEFTAAARPAPPNPGSAPERAVIERAPAPDALAWMRPEDLFFLQVQGSGVITFADGTSRRATFAATNGRPFVPIAKRMAAQGLIARADASALHVHDWLAGHRGPVAQAVMDEDPRYVFFHLARDDGGQPLGASGVSSVFRAVVDRCAGRHTGRRASGLPASGCGHGSGWRDHWTGPRRSLHGQRHGRG